MYLIKSVILTHYTMFKLPVYIHLLICYLKVLLLTQYVESGISHIDKSPFPLQTAFCGLVMLTSISCKSEYKCFNAAIVCIRCCIYLRCNVSLYDPIYKKVHVQQTSRTGTASLTFH